jgi:hypothetical protein
MARPDRRYGSVQKEARTCGWLVGRPADQRRGDQGLHVERLSQGRGNNVGVEGVGGDVAVGGSDDDFRHDRERRRRESREDVVAADARHAKVENDDAIRVYGEEIEAFLPVSCGVNRIESGAPQKRCNQIPDRVVVVNSERGVRAHRQMEAARTGPMRRSVAEVLSAGFPVEATQRSRSDGCFAGGGRRPPGGGGSPGGRWPAGAGGGWWKRRRAARSAGARGGGWWRAPALRAAARNCQRRERTASGGWSEP